MAFLNIITDWIKGSAFELQRMFFFSVKIIGSLFGRPIYVAETFEQMYINGVGSLFLVILTGIAAGQGMALEFSNELADFGAKNYLGRVMVLAIVRELGPILTGLMVAARVAAGITAEIGSMKASNQLDALVGFGIDPIRKLAAPRLISLIVMVPVLTVICDFIGLFGGWIIATLLAQVTTSAYVTGVMIKMNFGNIFVGLVKPVIFSLIIGIIACYKGFYASGGTKGVGRATTESVMLASITILVVNFIVTKVISGYLKGYL